MKSKLVMWLGVFALVNAPAAVLRAQDGPQGEDVEQIEAWEGRPGPARAMEHKARGARRMARVESHDEAGPGRMTAKVHKMMGGDDKGRMTVTVRKMMGGGPEFLSEDETLTVIKKHDAAFAKKVENLKTIAPPKYQMVMEMSGKLLAASKMEGDEATEENAVRMLALEFESKELSLKFDKASDADKKGIKEALKANLSELFDLKSKGQELRVKSMEAKLAKLKENQGKRKINKDKIVEQRVEQLTGEGYGW